MTEIWVPYGPVEVSFDIKQENLSQIVETQVEKMSKEKIDEQTHGLVFDSLLVLSSTSGTGTILDALLSKNKPNRIFYTKHSASLARRKAQEFQVPVVTELNTLDLYEGDVIDGSVSKVISDIRSCSNLLCISSVHYDPLFGLTGAASDIASLNKETKAEAFKRSFEELPCNLKSNANWYSTRLLQTCPNISVLEIIEKQNTGVIQFFEGEPESTHARVVDFWSTKLSTKAPRSERIIFGAGGGENDRTLTSSLARSFFNVATNLALKDSNSKICMLAECSEGLGSEALLQYVTGRITPGAKLDYGNYIEGLEVLLSFYKVQQDYELSMVSALPKFYGERFEFKMYSGAREAPYAVISPGSRAKILVAQDASSALFTLD